MTEEPDPKKIFSIEDYRRPTPPAGPPAHEAGTPGDDFDDVELPEDFDSDLFDDNLDDDASAFAPHEPPPPGLWERVGDIHPGFTYSLVLLILVCFAIELVTATLKTGDLLAGGSLSSPFISAGASAWQPFRAGEWWRLLSSVLLHANGLHVGSNLLALAVLGGVAERAYGHARFLVLFTLAGAVGSLASLVHQAQQAAAAGAGTMIPGSIGASGAVFGVGAAVVVAAFRMRGLLPAWRARALVGATLPLLLSSFAAGFARPGTDNAAHMGGALAGLILGLALPFTPRLSGRPESGPVRAAWAVAGLAALGALVACGAVAFEVSRRL
jgi:membrane associated rhomboid family serine protease